MKKYSKILLIAVIIISLFGTLMIYSSSYVWAEYKFNDPYKYLKSQSIFLILGYIVMFIVSKFPYQNYKKLSNIIFFICLGMLVLVLIPGIGTVRNGSRSWFGIGGLGVQPSEFTKLGLIIFTSKYLENNNKDLKDIKKGVLPILGVLFLVFALIMLEPDFGTGVVIVMIIIVLLFVSGVKMNFFIKLGVLGLLGVVVLVIIAPYRMERIVSFINPWSDPLGSGFQIIQSLYAIGPGGLLGLGFGNSVQKHFYLPEPQTDFIFSIISEEFGFLGVIIVATLFITIIYSGFKIAMNCEDKFGKYYIPQFMGFMEDAHIEKKHAVDFIIESIHKYPHGVTIFGIGPLTNIAMAIRKDSSIVPLIKEIRIMGGDPTDINIKEWNIFCDPEAAHIVFDAKVPIYEVGLNVTLKCQLTQEYRDILTNIHDDRFTLLTKMMEKWFKHYEFTVPVMHDPLAVATMFGDFCEFEKLPLTVGLENEKRAVTYCDKIGNDIYSAKKVNVDAFFKYFIKTIFEIDKN